MRSTRRILPVNLTDQDCLLFCLDGAVRNCLVGPQLAAQAIENATPIRDFAVWPGKRSYEGLWWSSTICGHIRFGSLLQREYLLTADFDPDVIALAAQPFAILWRRGIDDHTSHVPAYFVRLRTGDGRVIDVRHPGGLPASVRQLSLTRDLCAEIGWEYQVFTGASPALAANLRWLAGYRHRRHAPSLQVRDIVTASFQEPIALRAGIHRVKSCAGIEEATLVSHVFHMLWCRELLVNLDHPLSMDTQVSA